MGVLTVFFTRLLAIPSLAIAPLLLKLTRSKWVQAGGFCGCILANSALAVFYTELHKQDAAHKILFDSLYIVQLSFQSLPGVTTMAIPAEIFPSTVRGTGAGISAASGKLGAVLGSYFFTMMKNNGQISEIFWVVTCTSTVALVLTLLLTPLYSGGTIDRAEALAADGQMKEACKVLYSDPQGCEKGVPGWAKATATSRLSCPGAQLYRTATHRPYMRGDACQTQRSLPLSCFAADADICCPTRGLRLPRLQIARGAPVASVPTLIQRCRK